MVALGDMKVLFPSLFSKVSSTECSFQDVAAGSKMKWLDSQTGLGTAELAEVTQMSLLKVIWGL